MSIKQKISVLCTVADLFNQNQITWAVGGSFIVKELCQTLMTSTLS